MLNSVSYIWSSIQSFLFPHLRQSLGSLTDTEKRLVATLELARIEEFVPAPIRGFRGKPERDRRPFARAYIAKAVLGLSQTKDLLETLRLSESLRRICGWEPNTPLPSEASFCRVFAAFADKSPTVQFIWAIAIFMCVL